MGGWNPFGDGRESFVGEGRRTHATKQPHPSEPVGRRRTDRHVAAESARGMSDHDALVLSKGIWDPYGGIKNGHTKSAPVKGGTITCHTEGNIRSCRFTPGK